MRIPTCCSCTIRNNKANELKINSKFITYIIYIQLGRLIDCID